MAIPKIGRRNYIDLPGLGRPRPRPNTEQQQQPSLSSSPDPAATGTTVEVSLAGGNASTVASLLSDTTFKAKLLRGDAETLMQYREGLRRARQDAAVAAVDAELDARVEARSRALPGRGGRRPAGAEAARGPTAPGPPPDHGHLDEVQGDRHRLRGGGGRGVDQALQALAEHEAEIATLQQVAYPTTPYRIGKLMDRARVYLQIKVQFHAEVGFPMTLRQRRELIAAFQSEDTWR